MIIVGSTAAKYYGIDLKRKPSDLDIVGTRRHMDVLCDVIKPDSIEESKSFKNKFKIKKDKQLIEFDATEQPSDMMLMRLIEDEFQFNQKYETEYTELVRGKLVHPLLEEFTVSVAKPNAQYLMKRSHANYDVNFVKTFFDLKNYQEYFMRAFYNDLDGTYNFHDYKNDNLYKLLKEEVKGRVKTRSKINLKVSNDDFFEVSMRIREYIHDDIHNAVAAKTNHPMYEQCKTDLSQAFIDRTLFEDMPYDNQLDMVCEEAMVIGIERFYNKVGKNNEVDLYRKGLIKLAHTLCKGWFQDFILDNIFNLTKPRWKYLYKFEQARDNGLIRKVEK